MPCYNPLKHGLLCARRMVAETYKGSEEEKFEHFFWLDTFSLGSNILIY